MPSSPCGSASSPPAFDRPQAPGCEGRWPGVPNGTVRCGQVSMNRRGMLTITIAALPLLVMALAAAAAPTTRDRHCRGLCYSKCAAQHSCERPDAGPNCFTNFNKCKAVCRTTCSRSQIIKPPAPTAKSKQLTGVPAAGQQPSAETGRQRAGDLLHARMEEARAPHPISPEILRFSSEPPSLLDRRRRAVTRRRSSPLC